MTETKSRMTRTRSRSSAMMVLIKAALPEVPKRIRKTWVGVLNYADEASIRPEQLADFIALKGGSVKCGDTPPSQRRKEIARWKRDRDKGPRRRIEV